MATIKTTGTGSGLRVLTKTASGVQRVSCSCCAVCCMYPADQLGIGYAEADLPDELQINWTGQFTGAVSKSGSGYSGGGVTLQVVNNSWRLTKGGVSLFVGKCLIKGDGNLEPGDDLVEDNFEDVYNVTISGASGTWFDGPVTRTSLCEWEGQAVDGNTTTRVSLIYNKYTYKWKVSGDRISGPLIFLLFGSQSSGPQNKPNDRTYTITTSLPPNAVTTIVVTIPS